MEIKILEKKPNEVKIVINDLTMCEALRKELWEDDATVAASYTIKHPTESPVLHLVTDGKNAKKVLQDTIKRLEKKSEDILRTFKAAK